MSYLSYPAYVLNLLYITLFRWKSNEIIKCLPVTNSGFPGSRPPGGFMVISIKRVPGIPRDLIVNCLLEMTLQDSDIWVQSINWVNQLMDWINPLNSICLCFLFFFKELLCYVVTKPDMYLFSVHSLQLLYFLEIRCLLMKASWKKFS